MDEKRKKYLRIFKAEAEEHILTVNNGLLELEKGQAGAETIRAIFRAAHTLKGSARMLGLEEIGAIAHKMEDILKEVEAGKLTPTPEIIDRLLEGADAIEKLLEPDQESDPVDCDSVLSCLAQALETGTAAPAQPEEEADETAATTEQAPAEKQAKKDEKKKGRKKAATPAKKSEAGDGKASGVPEHAAQETRTEPSAAAARKADTLRVDTGRLDRLIDLAGELLVNKIKIENKTFSAKTALEDLSELIINFDKLTRNGNRQEAKDRLQSVRDFLHEFVLDFTENVIELDVNVQEIQTGALKLRMTPAGTMFEEFPRLVRDLARDLGKKISLEITGEDTELDKRLLEQLRGPLVHLIRNACDHGIETPEQRKQAGKDPDGHISLQAYHHGGTVVIEIADNGRGMDAARIKEVALAKGIIDERAAYELSDDEAYYLTILPGFSTSPLITDLSGRGVGLDVVKTNVEMLRGDMSIKSKPGAGTTIELRLPLTVSIIEALLIQQGGELYAIPLTAVDGVMRVKVSDLVQDRGREKIPVHGQLMPLIRLADLLGMKPLEGNERELKSSEDILQIVRLKFRNQKIALDVDKLMREQEILVKTLGTHLSKVPFVSGATILRKGEPALILNVFDIFAEAEVVQGKRIRDMVSSIEAERTVSRILVVDDSITTRTIEKNILERAGYDVVTAVSAEDAIEEIEKEGEKFDLFVFDVDMPGMNGFELTEKVRQIPSTTMVPVIICTSRATDEDKRQGIRVGAQAYIVKGSFDQNVLIDTVKSLIGEGA